MRSKADISQLNLPNVLSTQLDKDGRSQRDRLDRRRSAMLTVPATVDRWFITVIVKLYLQHDSVARVHLQQRILVYCGHD